MPDMPIIAVAGATSKQGRSVVKSLLREGSFQVRALTRDTASQQARSLARQGAEVVMGPLSLGHDADWDEVFAGAHGAFLLTPPIPPGGSNEFELGCRLADAATRAGVEHIVFSTLEDVDEIAGGRLFAPHFTDKARVADHIRTLPVASTFIILSLFYTNFMEYYVPRLEGDSLVFPIYLPEDFRAPFVDPLTATGPAVSEIFLNPEHYRGLTLPVIGDVISPREMLETFERVTGLKVEYRDAFTHSGLVHNFPELAADELHVKEILGMINFAVDYGYFRADRDLRWSRSVDPNALTWEQFLRTTGWRGGPYVYSA
ncbi:NmrA/HSCARG family protein [Actinomyces viscosus]|uniref:NmrA/HSCARG family protein n=1 Tax=Actinomyces viscosus TaxID=1656 RepID=UPI0028F0A9D4|nr:NmrA/HSCARG family protein [Actinomyces viscosus]